MTRVLNFPIFIDTPEYDTGTVKPQIIPAGREQHQAGNKEMMERGGECLGTSATGNWSK